MAEGPPGRGQVGCADDGSDGQRYWSPLKGAERSLGQLLAGYHASGNVVLLYRACAGRLDDGGHGAFRLAALLPVLHATEAHLRDSPALTPVGRALCEPLMELLGAAA